MIVPVIVPVIVPKSPLDSVIPRDTTKPPVTKADSAALRRKLIAADSIKAPLAHAERPANPDGRWLWSGEDLRSTGAVTLADLLSRIPGVTAFRANWIPAPQFIAYNGDPGRVRVFFDGVEMDAIDSRNGSVLDLATVPLWQLEEVSAERAAGELRVHLRSWRVDRTTPFTRTDMTSGSEGTNLYRGFFGRRMRNGAAIQLAAQQYSTVSPRTGGDGSSLQVFGRLGWARKRWSVDATWNHVGIDRNATVRYPLDGALTQKAGVPVFKGALGSAYGRVAWGDPDAKAAPWAQLIASTQNVGDESDTVRKWIDSTFVPRKDSTLVDTVATPRTATFAASRSQYVLAAGASRWGLDGSVTARLRAGNGRSDLSPSARLGYTRRFVSLAAYAETRGADSTRRLDATARVAPWRWLTFDGAFGSYAPAAASAGGPAFTVKRLEISTVLRGLTISGGGMSRGLTMLAAPRALDSSLVRVLTGEARGVLLGVRGRVYGDLSLDIGATWWDDSGAYRPRRDVHTGLTLDSGWPKRFPRGNFHVFAEARYDTRSPMFFPTAAGTAGATSSSTDVISARLEIRISSGTVFIQFINPNGRVYETTPGYLMPRNFTYYGLRWNFWN